MCIATNHGIGIQCLVKQSEISKVSAKQMCNYVNVFPIITIAIFCQIVYINFLKLRYFVNLVGKARATRKFFNVSLIDKRFIKAKVALKISEYLCLSGKSNSNKEHIEINACNFSFSSKKRVFSEQYWNRVKSAS